jgi:N-acetylmuramic acid 6-phosphate etherase
MAPGSTLKRYLGIEGGGTHTVGLLTNDRGDVLARVDAGPANLKLLTDQQLVHHLRALAEQLSRPATLAIGLAGAWVEADWRRIRIAAARVWPGVPCYATHDLETALTAAGDDIGNDAMLRVLVLSGTGSGCYGRSTHGTQVKVGGWGHVLGDRGSGYDIGMRALRAALDHYDRTSHWPGLGRCLLRTLQLNEPYDLIPWVQAATKAQIAGLAVDVFTAWNRGDSIASVVLAEAAERLATDAVSCARRLTRAGNRVHFVLAGSVLLRQPRFAELLTSRVKRLWPGATVTPLKRDSVWGAVELAKQLDTHASCATAGPVVARAARAEAPAPPPQRATVRSTRISPTEQRNPLSMNLDKLSLRNAIRLVLGEDARVPRKLARKSALIERVVRAVVRAFRSGGRLFYAGAGTSGRLGVLDASECPATFSAPPEMVQGIIAGGDDALRRAVERVEDDPVAGATAVQFRGVNRKDVLIGIAASGTTPFVWGALIEAKRRGATTVLLSFNPYVRIPQSLRPSIVLAVNLGPELLTGSTRLKAGTATKLLLNIFTTLSMVRIGKVVSNLMVDLEPANLKLRHRATRIVRELTGAGYDDARLALERSGWVVKDAVSRLRSASRAPGARSGRR